MEAVIQLVQWYEANYPELLYRVYGINGKLSRKRQKRNVYIDIKTKTTYFNLFYGSPESFQPSILYD